MHLMVTDKFINTVLYWLFLENPLQLNSQLSITAYTVTSEADLNCPSEGVTILNQFILKGHQHST